MKKTLLLISMLLTGCVSLLAQPISQREKEEIFIRTKKLFGETYYFSQTALSTIAFLDKQWKAGKYKPFTTIDDFLAALGADLKNTAHDNHLNFFHVPALEAANKGSEQPAVPWFFFNDKFSNNGLTDLRVLPGDIGYMKVQAFGAFDDILPGAFTFLQHTQALIIDLRGNGGGMPSNLLISYLLPPDSIHLLTIYSSKRTDSVFTIPQLAGPRYINKPVYLLTDKGSFSSTEEFAYDLQQLKRVTIVGETTGGGANPGGAFPLYNLPDGSRIDLFVPTARVENAISKTNWEGVGVNPDINVAPEKALNIAHQLALEWLAEHTENIDWKKLYLEIRDRVKKG